MLTAAGHYAGWRRVAGDYAAHVLVLAGMTLVFLVLGAWWFKWTAD
ncbi:MAG: hypothetical protein R3E95_07360 [Thiolinea sp.]